MLSRADVRSMHAAAALVRIVLPVAVLVLAALPAMSDAHDLDCTFCHMGGTEEANASAEAACQACHQDVLLGQSGEQALMVAHLGRPADSRIAGPGLDAQIGCITCHSPHPNGRPHQLRDLGQASARDFRVGLDETSAFCAGCHETFVGGGHRTQHPVGVPASTGHALDHNARADVLPLFDVKGTADSTDDVIGCQTCHAVHRNANLDLLRWGSGGEVWACTSCHSQFRSLRRVAQEDVAAIVKPRTR